MQTPYQRMIAELQFVVDTILAQSDPSAIHSLVAVIDYFDQRDGTELREHLERLPA